MPSLDSFDEKIHITLYLPSVGPFLSKGSEQKEDEVYETDCLSYLTYYVGL